MRRCLLSHTEPRSAAPSFSSPFGGADQGSEQAVAIFYGSGGEFSQLCIPDELRWRVETIGLQVECGHVLLLDVVAAIKSAMPPDWLSEHKMDADCSSIVFSMSTREIIDVYASALRAWGAENPIGPGIDDSILSSGSISVESISATAFDVPKTISQPNGRGFRFSENDSQVSYPNGPISLFTQAVVGPHTPLKFAHFSFKYLGGNDAWSVGVIPESQSENPEVLWRSRDAIGRVNGSHGSHLRSFQPNRGDTLASCIDAVQSVWFLSVNGAVVAREHIPPSCFPVRLGFCGHNGSTFQLIPGAEVPPEILGQCKMSMAVNNASKWQVISDSLKIHDDLVRLFNYYVWPHCSCSGFAMTAAGSLTIPTMPFLWKKLMDDSFPGQTSLQEHSSRHAMATPLFGINSISTSLLLHHKSHPMHLTSILYVAL